jgi:hypothetical protein
VELCWLAGTTVWVFSSPLFILILADKGCDIVIITGWCIRWDFVRFVGTVNPLQESCVWKRTETKMSPIGNNKKLHTSYINRVTNWKIGRNVITSHTQAEILTYMRCIIWNEKSTR